MEAEGGGDKKTPEEIGLPCEPVEGNVYQGTDGRDYTYINGSWGRTIAEAKVIGYLPIQDDLYYHKEGGKWKECGIVYNDAIKGKMVKLFLHQEALENYRRRKIKEDSERAFLEAREKSERYNQAVRDKMMWDNPLGIAYNLTPSTSIMEATKEAGDGNYLTAGGILLLEFAPGEAEDIVRSSRRIVKGKTPRGIQKLDSHVQRGDIAYRGVKVTQESVNNIIRDVMNSPDRIMNIGTPDKPLRDQQGRLVVDFFNPNTGQGVRLDRETGEFHSWVNFKL